MFRTGRFRCPTLEKWLRKLRGDEGNKETRWLFGSLLWQAQSGYISKPNKFCSMSFPLPCAACSRWNHMESQRMVSSATACSRTGSKLSQRRSAELPTLLEGLMHILSINMPRSCRPERASSAGFPSSRLEWPQTRNGILFAGFICNTRNISSQAVVLELTVLCARCSGRSHQLPGGALCESSPVPPLNLTSRWALLIALAFEDSFQEMASARSSGWELCSRGFGGLLFRLAKHSRNRKKERKKERKGLRPSRRREAT